VRVPVVAARVEPLLAVPALSTGDERTYDHAVADLVPADLVPDRHHLADKLVAEHVTLTQERDVAADEVQIGAAGDGARDPDDDVAAVADGRLRYLAHRELVDALPHQCPHIRPSS